MSVPGRNLGRICLPAHVDGYGSADIIIICRLPRSLAAATAVLIKLIIFAPHESGA